MFVIGYVYIWTEHRLFLCSLRHFGNVAIESVARTPHPCEGKVSRSSDGLSSYVTLASFRSGGMGLGKVLRSSDLSSYVTLTSFGSGGIGWIRFQGQVMSSLAM